MDTGGLWKRFQVHTPVMRGMTAGCEPIRSGFELNYFVVAMKHLAFQLYTLSIPCEAGVVAVMMLDGP